MRLEEKETGEIVRKKMELWVVDGRLIWMCMGCRKYDLKELEFFHQIHWKPLLKMLK